MLPSVICTRTFQADGQGMVDIGVAYGKRNDGLPARGSRGKRKRNKFRVSGRYCIPSVNVCIIFQGRVS